MQLTFTVSEEFGAKLQELARDMECELDHLLRTATEEFYAEERSVMDDILAGERDIEAGRFVPHEEVKAWLKDYAAGKRLPAPTSTNRQKLAS